MPVVSKGRRELSPLDEEEPILKMDHPLVSLNHKPDPSPSSPVSILKSQTKISLELSQLLSSLAMLILTNRDIDTPLPVHDEKLVSLTKHSCIINSQYLKDQPQSTAQVHQILDNFSITGAPICIEVSGQSLLSSNCQEKDSLLIEKWILQITNKKTSSTSPLQTTMQFLRQAIRSFLHFSQINSWAVSCGGQLPFHLVYRLNSEVSMDDCLFPLCPLECHTFPLVILPHQSSTLQVTVYHLPRLDQIPPTLINSMSKEDSKTVLEETRCKSVSSPRDIVRTKVQKQLVNDIANGSNHDISTSYGLPVNLTNEISASNGLIHQATNQIRDHSLASNSTILGDNPIRSSVHVSTTQCIVIPSSTKPLFKTRLTPPGTDQPILTRSPQLKCEGFPFSPPTPSPLSPKFTSSVTKNHLAGLGRESSRYKVSNDSINSGVNTSKPLYNTSTKPNGLDPVIRRTNCPINKEASPSRILISKINSSLTNSSDVTCNNKTCSKTIPSTQVSNFTFPQWKGGVRPPGASSPVPFFVRSPSLVGSSSPSDDTIDPKDLKRLKRRSCGINIKGSSRPLPVRSMSLPSAVPNLCLLGTFEESVLNGRIDPCGYVEGFTAELGASGSFCPQHITLPVTASFFNLSDDGGPSPYLGQIDLTDIGKRGYRVPKKGTVQLTLFNPNKTVVKIYIVTYDHTDMPPKTNTFIRQKTVSRPYHTATESVWPSLHYLIHLRFLCSKSNRVYLHTDIKLIFARRAPDTDPDLSKVSLLTTTEGPSDPKYGPLSSE